MGVDVFFVLSGFLITTLLAREERQSGGVSLPRFWGRRFLRLMPAYWLYAGVITFLFLGAHWGRTAVVHGWTPADYIASIWLFTTITTPRGLASGSTST